MKRFFPLAALLAAILLPCTAVRGTDAETRHKKDSVMALLPSLEGEAKLRAYDNLAGFVFVHENSIDSVKKYYGIYAAEAKRQGDKRRQGVAMLSPVGAMINRGLYAEAVGGADEILPFLHENELWDLYYQCASHKAMALFHMGRKDDAFEATNKTYGEAKDADNLTGMASTLRVLGQMYVMSLRYQDAEACFRESLDVEKRVSGIPAGRLYAYAELAGVLCTLPETDKSEAEALLKEWEEYLTKWEEENIRNGGERAETWWINLDTRYIELYYVKEDYDRVWEYCDRLEGYSSLTQSMKSVVYYYRMFVAIERKQYAAALGYNNMYYDVSYEMGDLGSVNEALTFRAYINALLGNAEEVLTTVDSMSFGLDEIRRKDINRQLDELRTVYEVDKLEAQKARQRMIILFTGIGCACC